MQNILRYGITCVFVSVWKEATDELAGAWAAAGWVLGRGSGWGACMRSTLAVAAESPQVESLQIMLLRDHALTPYDVPQTAPDCMPSFVQRLHSRTVSKMARELRAPAVLAGHITGLEM